MSIGTAANFKVADVLINGRSNQRVNKRPIVVIDFKNGIYTVDGVTVARSDLVGDDIVWNPTTPFDPEACIIAGVGLTNEATPVLLGAALSRLLSGATMIVDFECRNTIVFEPFGAAYAADLVVRLDHLEKLQVGDYVANVFVNDTSVLIEGDVVVAFTISPTHLAASTGKTAISTTPTTPVPLEKIGMILSTSDHVLYDIIRSIKIIPQVADQDLPALCI